MAKTYFKVEGMKELRKSLDRLGKIPQKHVTSSARKGMTVIVRRARANAPEDTGMLKKGIIKVGERSKTKGKKAFRVVFDRSMNDIFQKTAKYATHAVTYHGHGRSKKDVRQEANKSYYPVSQEYGYFTKNGRYIPGFKFGHNALDDNKQKAQEVMISTMKDKVDKQIAKEGLK